MSGCDLCPRCCLRRPGFCGAGEAPRVFRWGPHFGEEPPITGERGSGCVFFSRCTMKCVYCQNSPWSWRGQGEDKTVEELTAIFRELALKDRVENWNLVSPTPYLPQIRAAVQPLVREGIKLPFVYNSSGYERVETLREYAELCDLALFDLRYSRNESALKYSAAPGYVEAARAAVRWAAARPGAGKLPPLIVRILVLPGLAEEAIENLAWLATEVSSAVPVSIMSQYTPAYRAQTLPPPTPAWRCWARTCPPLTARCGRFTRSARPHQSSRPIKCLTEFCAIIADMHLSLILAAALDLVGGAGSQPVQITAENTYYDHKEGVACLRGGVAVDDGRSQLHADKAYVYMAGTNDVERIVALGHVAMTNGSLRAYGEKASYHHQKGLVVLYSGDAALAEVRMVDAGGDRVLKGAKIRFWPGTEQVEVLQAEITAPAKGVSRELLRK